MMTAMHIRATKHYCVLKILMDIKNKKLKKNKKGYLFCLIHIYCIQSKYNYF